jgi:hypothetical protein
MIDFSRLQSGTILYGKGIAYKVLSVHHDSKMAVCQQEANDGSFRIKGPVPKDIIEALRRKP